MREILFRGKSNCSYGKVKKGDWLYGMTISRHCYDDEEITSYYIGSGNNTIDGKTLGQYTGLTDKNGKKIFEGDIIKQIFCLKQTNGSLEREIVSAIEYGISWNYSNVCGVCERFSDGSGIAMLSVMNTSGIVDCEIIGNIHDNPELLKGGE